MKVYFICCDPAQIAYPDFVWRICLDFYAQQFDLEWEL